MIAQLSSLPDRGAATTDSDINFKISPFVVALVYNQKVLHWGRRPACTSNLTKLLNNIQEP